MKKRTTIFLLALMLLCAVVFAGYRIVDRIRSDETPPQITVSTDVFRLSVSDPKELLLSGVSAADSKDGDVTDSLLVENIQLLDGSGRISVSYAAFDHAGNVAKATREAAYTDYVRPRFTLNQPLLFRSGLSFDVLSILGATDALDGNIQHRIRATSLDGSSISAMGVHEVQFQVTNSMGDTVSLVIPVEVYDPTLYDAELDLTAYLVYLRTGDSFQKTDYLKSFTYLGDTTALGGNLPAGFSLKTDGNVQTDVPGVYPVDYYVTYTDANTLRPELTREYVSHSKLIVVVEG